MQIPVEVGTKLSKTSDGSTIHLTYFKSIVRSLRYLTYARLDITYRVGLVNKFMEAPKHSHLQITKRIMWYIKSTLDQGLLYSNIANDLIEYPDNDRRGDQNDRRSTMGHIFMFDSTTISWSSKK